MVRRTPPRFSPGTEAERQRRMERLAAAMRENLRRRKAQLRTRAEGGRSADAAPDRAGGPEAGVPDPEAHRGASEG
ncbi:hypothetical protein HRbin39_00393 [bacterium HR39]|nr:hypothetical protein HRbin39_00393 [bacterium HR39]